VTTAFTQAERIPAGPAQQAYLHGLISGLANQDPELAAEYAVRLPLGQSQAQVIQSVALQWSRSDPAAAVKWLSTLTLDQAPIEAYQQVTGQWMFVDSERAKQWLLSLPAGEHRDRLLEQPISTLTELQPQEAVQMIELVTSPERKQGLMQHLASQWLQQDRAAAEQWIQGSALSADFKQRLLAVPTRK
jgi:hypothetical protein